jgi:hypothetical protein
VDEWWRRLRRDVTEAEIVAARTPAGGWTRETLTGWGVPWPPPHGWKEALLNPKRNRAPAHIRRKQFAAKSAKG